jgi:tRNA modification GTPase
MDLVAVEGLADLIAAETEMQRRLAAEHASGGLSRLYDSWARRLTHARAMIEAELDFADEDDVPDSVAGRIWDDMRLLRQEIVQHLDGAAVGEIIRDGLNVVIAGPPNAGKSSLLNHLSGRDVAIVTEVPGTTRDVLKVDLDLGGFSVHLHDTAGLRDTDDVVEREGIRRTHQSIDHAHLLLLLSSDPTQDWQELSGAFAGPIIRVRTKADLSESDLETNADVAISVRTGDGVGDLLALIGAQLPDIESGGALAFPTRQRHFSAVESAAASILHVVPDNRSARSLGGLTWRICWT